MAEQAERSLPSPLLLPVICWCAGICLAVLLQLSLLWIAIITGIVLTGSLLVKFRTPALLLLLLWAGFLRMFSETLPRPDSLQTLLAKRESITQPVRGKVLRIIDPERMLYLVRITNVNGIRTNSKAWMSGKDILLPGDTFEAMAKLNPIHPDPILDTSSPTNMTNRSKVQIKLQPVYRLGKLKEGSPFYPERIRHRLLNSLERKLGAGAPFAKALLLNDRTEDKDWVQQLIQGGLLHLIAISGMHVVFFYMVFVNLLNMVLPKRTSEVIFVILMLVYSALCQWSPPVMRAIIVIMLIVIAKWLQRPVSSLQLLCLSLIIITAVSPFQLFSIGLQLSYFCVLGLIYLHPKIRLKRLVQPLWKHKMLKILYYLVNLFTASLTLSIVLLPVMFFYFGRGSLNGIVGTMLGVYLVELMLPLTLTLMLLPDGNFLFNWLRACYEGLRLVFELLVQWTASLPFYVDRINLPLSLLLAMLFIILAIAVRIRYRLAARKLSYVLLCLAVPFFAWSQFPQHKPFTLTIFNAGQGDCSLAQFPDGQTLMVDTGPQYYNAANEPEGSWFGAKTGLWQKHSRISRLDLLVLTHLHSDHAGGLEDILSTMQVRNLLVSSQTAQLPAWHELERKGLFKQTKVRIAADTLSFGFAGSRVSILHPAAHYNNPDENASSLVLRLDYQGFSALLTGDITSDVEAMLVESCPEKLDADFLKAPHHGSRSSNSTAFIRAVSPGRVCITSSKNNQFYFPHQETLKRYRNYGLEPELTSNGSLIVSGGKELF